MRCACVLARGLAPALAAAPVTHSTSPRRRPPRFVKGMPLLENELYKVHASRRDAPGQAARCTRRHRHHLRARGKATLVTGGSLVGGSRSRRTRSAARALPAARARARAGRRHRGAERHAALVQGRPRPGDLLRRQSDGPGSALNASRFASPFALTPALAASAPARRFRGRAARDVDLATDAGAEARGGALALLRCAHRRDACTARPMRTASPPARRSRRTTIEPRAGCADFDDSAWASDRARLAGDASRQRSPQLQLVPHHAHDPREDRRLRPTGSTVVFETTLDDYAEIWVDGEIARAIGQRGGSVVGGWNAPNRLVIGARRQARPEDPARGVRRERPALGPARELHLDARRAALDFYRGAGTSPYAIRRAK